MMTLEMKTKIEWRPTTEILSPSNHSTVKVYRDFWWLTNDKGELAFYEDRDPLCNMSRPIAETMAAEWMEHGLRLVRVPLAFVRIDSVRI